MNTRVSIKAFSLGLICVFAQFGAPKAIGQSLLTAGDAITLVADPAPVAPSPDDSAYADGFRAINSSRWSVAIPIFAQVASQGGVHADAALYWKAYAENKLGQPSTALDTCSTLRQAHPGSSWIEECGALEIEIHGRNGRPTQPKTEQSDDLKLLALATLMQHDEKAALAQIDQILNSNDSSEKLKQGAVYIMGEHHSDTIYPQIVRLSFVDGDVRIDRAQGSAHRKDVTWEAAAAGIPLESGYNIVTGEGRAEIELEDASTLYLAPNSVLTINDLSTTEGIPHTEMALLSGTVTLHVYPFVAGEVFILQTPTDSLITRYPQTAYFRVSSYTDGMAFTPMSGGTLGVTTSLGPVHEELTPGHPLYFKNGVRIMDAGPIHPPDFSGWDAWVADRVKTRADATAQALKDSGLAAPIPGLAELNGNGYFFTCEPYGTCWEPLASGRPPAQGSTIETSAAAKAGEMPSSLVAQNASGQTSAPARNIRIIGPPAASGPPPMLSDMGTFGACLPGGVGMLTQGVWPTPAQFHDPVWAWAVCNSGSWIYQGNRYVWVVGHRHHRPCVHWIKSGHTVAFVPIHPRDVKDRAPVNRLNGVFAVSHKGGVRSIEPIRLNTLQPMQVLKEAPREFRAAALMPLPHAAEPHMEAHAMKEFATAKGSPIKPTSIPITFNAKSQAFVMPHEVMHAGHAVSVLAPIGNRSGDLQAHSGIVSGGGGFRGGFSGGGYHGGMGGGASHGGGGGGFASGGGGASHGGGGVGGGGSSGGGGAAGGGGSHK